MDPPGMKKIEHGEEAYDLGKSYHEWDEEQLSQSAEMANDIAPRIRELAGFEDGGMGTFRDVPVGKDDEVMQNEDDLWDCFWGGYYVGE